MTALAWTIAPGDMTRYLSSEKVNEMCFLKVHGDDRTTLHGGE